MFSRQIMFRRPVWTSGWLNEEVPGSIFGRTNFGKEFLKYLALDVPGSVSEVIISLALFLSGAYK